MPCRKGDDLAAMLPEHLVGYDGERLGADGDRRIEPGVNLIWRGSFFDAELQSECAGGLLGRVERLCVRLRGITQYGDVCRCWDCFLEELQPLGAEFLRKQGQARDVAAGVRKARGETRPYRIEECRRDYRDRPRRLARDLCGHRCI